MTGFIQNWSRMLLWFLLGFSLLAFSLSARADAAADYTSMGCGMCHGSPAPGSIKINNFATSAELAAYIDVYMPKSNPSICVGTCAQQMAAYLKPSLPPNPNNQPPVAKATIYDGSLGVTPLKISFYHNGSTDDQGIVSFLWNFGDGTTASSTDIQQLIQHTYTAIGTYTATLTVTDAYGLTNSTNLTIRALSTHTPPVPNASRSTNLSGVAPLTAQFDGSLSTCIGGCKDFYWRFSDNSSLNSVRASRIFKDVGTHNVKFEVYDDGKFTDPASKASINLTVTVTASTRAPTANATKSQNLKGAAPLTAKFDASLSNCDNNCSNYAWIFGDGSSSSGSSPTVDHVYTTPGNYTATMTVTDKSNGKKTSTTVAVKVVPAESLATYVQACKTQLEFQNVSIPDLNCYDGDLFAGPNDFGKNSDVSDYVGYRKITDQVDLAFACRWLKGNKFDNPLAPISIEMLLHNRQNGNTCFFSAKGFVSGDPFLTSANIVSPTSTNASSFWDAPASVDAKVRCIGCHVSGPYIATPYVAPFLAKYGLLNNGHDTLSNVTLADLSTPNKNVKYNVISGTVNGAPGAFSEWNSLKQSYIHPTESSCSQGCHMLNTASPQGVIGQLQLGLTTILDSPAGQMNEINHFQVMPPNADGSDYRWINLDTSGDSSETETFAKAKTATATMVPKLLNNCAAPNVMEAHVVGSTNSFLVSQPNRFAFLPDRLSTFNLKQGLVCLNNEQDSGQCQNYKVRYECTAANGTKSWTDWYSSPSATDGDHEERWRHANVCVGATATSIEAAFTHPSNGWTYSSIGPNDRLAGFSAYGLTCNTADQPDGQCSNYVVRYSSCTTAPVSRTKKFASVFTGRYLTAINNSNNASAKGQPLNTGWNTQSWVIEPVANTEYVRLKNTGTNTYLNVTTQSESATVVTYSLNNDWDSQKWIMESVSGNEVRLKNLWSGRYLTIGDVTSTDPDRNYAPIFSQALNTTWSSQRWRLE